MDVHGCLYYCKKKKKNISAANKKKWSVHLSEGAHKRVHSTDALHFVDARVSFILSDYSTILVVYIRMSSAKEFIRCVSYFEYTYRYVVKCQAICSCGDNFFFLFFTK